MCGGRSNGKILRSENYLSAVQYKQKLRPVELVTSQETATPRQPAPPKQAVGCAGCCGGTPRRREVRAGEQWSAPQLPQAARCAAQ